MTKIVTGTIKINITAAVTDTATTKWPDGFRGLESKGEPTSWRATVDTWDDNRDLGTPAVGVKGVFFPSSLLGATLSVLAERPIGVGVTASTGPMKRKRYICLMCCFTCNTYHCLKFSSCLTLKILRVIIVQFL